MRFLLLAVLSALFYFAWITSVPNGFYQDEISFLLTADCLKWAGVDRQGESWPFFFHEFGGDYRLPITPYLWFLAVKFFSIGPWGARIMTAGFGFLAAAGLVWTFFKRKWIVAEPLIWGFLFFFVVTSSWFWSGHRFAAEPALVSFLTLLQWVSFERYFSTRQIKWMVSVFMTVALGPYLYRAFIPLLAFNGLAFVFLTVSFSDFKERKSKYICGLLMLLALGILAELPILWDMLYGFKVMSRVQIVTQSNGPSFLVRFLKHIDGVFWFLKGDHNKRHHHGFFGEIHLFFLIPFCFFLKDLFQRKLDRFWIVTFAWALVGCIPAALTTDGVPHATRSFIALIPLMACCLRGIPRVQPKWMKGMIALGMILSIAELIWYGTVYPARSADAWKPIDTALLNQRALSGAERFEGIDTIHARYFYVHNTHDTSACYPSRK